MQNSLVDQDINLFVLAQAQRCIHQFGDLIEITEIGFAYDTLGACLSDLLRYLFSALGAAFRHVVDYHIGSSLR